MRCCFRSSLGVTIPSLRLLSAAATAMAFGGLLLVPVGLAWLISGPRRYGLATSALLVAMLVAVLIGLATAAAGSLSAAVVMVAAAMGWATRLWKRIRAAQTTGAELPRSVPIALLAVPLIVLAAHMTLTEPAEAWSRNRAIANADTIIADIERFRERTGGYPVALSSLHPDYHPGVMGVERYRYERSGEAYNLSFEHPSATLGVQEIVMYNPRREQDISSHAIDLLQLSEPDIRRQRGYFAAHDLSQTGWRRFLFD